MCSNSPTPSHDLARLVASAIAGDPSELATLLERVRPYLHVLVRRHLHASERARLGDSDIVQETLMRIHRGIGAFKVETQVSNLGHEVAMFLAWMGKILSHVITDLQRYSQAEKRDRSREIDARVMDELSAGSTPEQQALRAEKAIVVAEAVERLPANQRELVQSRFFDGLSFREISDRTGKSEAALRVLCWRALGNLREDGQLRRWTRQP
jgi:RNA polymerase sigma-70 factor (ECF subfamily)